MNENDLQRLVRAAVRAVLAELGGEVEKPDGPLARVLVGDTNRGLDYALAALRTLGNEGLQFEYLVTSGGTSQVNPGHLRELPGTLGVTTYQEAGCPLQQARGADLIIAAALDRATAVRVALTMAESFADRFLLEGLILGKPVVIATDGFERAAREATPQLRGALAETRSRLEVFGATCAPATELAASVRGHLGGMTAPNATAGRPLITVADIEAADGALVLPPGAIVTPLALDRARELGVTLRRVPG